MLICEFSGLSVEQLKKYKKMLKKQNFSCSMITKGEYSGKLCIKPINIAKEINWNSLVNQKNSDLKKKIIPIFFIDNTRILGLNYFKECVKYENKKVCVPVVLKPFLSLMQSMIAYRCKNLLAVFEEKKRKEN